MTSNTRTLALRLGSVAAFVLGLFVAMQWSPEWIVRDAPSPDAAIARFDEVAAAAGYEPTTEARKAELEFGPSRSEINIRGEASETYGGGTREWLAKRGLGIFATVEAPVSHPSGRQGMLNVSFDMQLHATAIEFTTSNFGDFVKPGTVEVKPEDYIGLATLLLREGETLGAPGAGELGGQRFTVFPVIGADPPESVTATEPPGMQLVNRRPGSLDDIQRLYRNVFDIWTIASRGALALLKFVLLAFFVVLFIVLTVKRSIGLRTGIMLGTLCFALGIGAGFDEIGPSWMLWMRLAIVFLVSIWCALVWSSSESWLRATAPDYLQSIDTIASFRPGPRSARAVTNGWAAGLALAGLVLLVEAIATRYDLVSSTSAAVQLGIFGSTSPLSRAVVLAGTVLAATAAAHYFTGRSERILGIALTTLAVLPAYRLSHWSLTIAVAAAIGFVLNRTVLRGGAAALLAAALNMIAAPSAVFALRHVEWMPWSAAGVSALVAAPLAFALIGMRRPADEETHQIVTPRFMRRLEEERRVKFEMGLLAEMQLRMLPDSPPRLEGWDIAAQSVLASEVGGDLYDYIEDEDGDLWIAIGDVSGHGYQCAIAQAMTKASLTSLVSAKLSPSDVLGRVDRVLRRGGSARTFTSLALAKLDPKTGIVTLSNAGNPYPVHVTADGRVSEIEMPSLPLGMGPARSYVDVRLELGSRDYLLFYSDGLVEVRNQSEEMLGFEKPAAIVRMRRGQTAAELVSALERAWRDHLGDAEVQDDTTIVVVRRG